MAKADTMAKHNEVVVKLISSLNADLIIQENYRVFVSDVKGEVIISHTINLKEDFLIKFKDVMANDYPYIRYAFSKVTPEEL